MKPLDDATMRIVDVDELSSYIRDLFDSDPLLDDIWVRGEVSNFRRSPSGHYYFVIKSANAQLKSVLFKGNAGLVTHLPTNGEAILGHGRVSTYPAYGEYQLYVDQILPEGAGLLQLQFDELRKRLEAEGLFEPTRKRPLPEHPTVIGVVTSSTGSVWHDIQDVLRRRYPLAELILSPALVQGDAAPNSIVRAISRMIDDGRAEVLIVGRGGGSIEDLWAFNDERVIRAIYRCPIPIVAAVGHETDVTLTDLVADVRAPTPSAATEIVAPHIREYRRHLSGESSTLSAAVSGGIIEHRHSLDEMRRLLSSHDPQWKLEQERLRVDRLGEALNVRFRQRLTHEQARVEATSRQLALLDPRQLLGRGYALLNDAQTGRRVRGINDLTTGARLRLTLRDGRVIATVDEIEAANEKDVRDER